MSVVQALRRWFGTKLLDRKSVFALWALLGVLLLVGIWAPIPQWLATTLTLVAIALFVLSAWAQRKTAQELQQSSASPGTPLS